MSAQAKKPASDSERDVLTKAVLRAADALGMSRAQLSEVVGRDRSGITRNGLDPKSKPGELALMIVRLYRSLYAMVGGEPKAMKHWMKTSNRYFQQAPIEHIRRVDGLVHVVQYLDAMRGKV